VAGCRGYNCAEATAGGFALDEIDPATMASRICPGLYLLGEMLDVDGRIGRFNFQRAWSTGFVAGTALGDAQLCECGNDLIFLGRIHPDKGVHLAIEVARLSGLPLLIAGIVQDQTYFRERVEPHLDGQNIRYIRPVGVPEKNALFGRARALLHLNTVPERFGLVLAEANAAGVPVIAMDLGSCREVIEDGRTAFLVKRSRGGAGAITAF
jgi:glycosyltransferase involved in cell wall biosynthesis